MPMDKRTVPLQVFYPKTTQTSDNLAPKSITESSCVFISLYLFLRVYDISIDLSVDIFFFIERAFYFSFSSSQ